MPTTGPLSSFRPPVIPELVFTGADGAPIDYGNRWNTPPEWAYSTVRNIERFEPVCAHAEALIMHLAATCDVDVLDDARAAEDVLFPVRAARRAVRLTPTNRAGAPLTFVFFDDFQVTIHAGFAQDFLFPVCSCEACDETAAPLIQQMTDLVDAVTTGAFQEFFQLRGYGYRIEGGEEGWRTIGRENRARLKQARAAQRSLGPWQPWPLR